MACSKYTLTNTGSSIVNFSYQRCDDAMWEYQVELNQGQTKTIWLLDSTYSTAFSTSIVEVDLGIFPPVALSPTPTISVTPSNTPTISVTPSNTPTLSLTPSVTASSTPTNTPTPTYTPTQTVTPTNVVRTTQSVGCHDENTAEGACNCDQGATVFTNGVDFASSTLAWSDEFGTNTGNPEGFYVQDGIVYQVATGCGPGCITGAAITVVGPCGATPTPTVTATQTPTPTDTPQVSPTPTNTQTPTVTTTPTNTSTVTPTNTQTGTPAVTPTTTNTPTASSFGTNTFRVDIVNAGRARTNSYSLTQIPYDTTPGSGFTASTGTFPITAGQAVFGTHQAFSSSNFNYITFEMECAIDGELSIVAFQNGGFLRSQGPYNLVSSGPNTVTFALSATILVTDTLYFQLS